MTADAATVSIAVPAATGCGWTAASNADFLKITDGSSGTGAGTVTVGIAANSGAARTGTLTIGHSTVTVTQSAPLACAFTLSPSGASVPAAGGDVSVSVTVTQGTGCAWTATTTDSFVKIKAGGTGTGSGVVVVSLDSNLAGQRTGTAIIAGHTISIDQVASGCVFSPPPSDSLSIGQAGGTLTIAITVLQGAACTWTAFSNVDFIKFVGGSGTGSGTLTVTVAANAGGNRQGSINVAGHNVTVAQAGTCDFDVLPVNATTVPAVGGSVTIAVSLHQAGSCSWTATVDQPFLTIQPLDPTTNSVVVVVAPNTGAARTGNATVAGHVLTISQLGTGCTFNVMPLTTAIPAAGLLTSINISVQGTSCAWTATTTASFITITAGASGTGGGGVSLTIAANSGATRTGTVVAAGHVVTFTQSGSGSVAILSYRSASGDFVGQGQSRTITLSGPNLVVSLDASPSHVGFRSSDLANSWSVDFAAPAGGALTTGFYDDSARWPFQALSQAGLDVGIGIRGCNTSSGRFVVGTAEFDGAAIRKFHAVFEQHCENFSPSLIGDFWFDINGSTVVPPLSLPPTPLTPTTFVSIQSTPGDPAGGGQSVSYTIASAVFSARPDNGGRHVGVWIRSVLPGFSWTLDFAAPVGQQLTPGVYTGVGAWPFGPTNLPGLSIAGNIGCTVVMGQFQILEIQVDPSNAVQRFHATFQQTCNGSSAPLTGEVYIVANPWR